MGRRKMFRGFILNLQVFLFIVTAGIYSAGINQVEAGFQPSSSPTEIPLTTVKPETSPIPTITTTPSISSPSAYLSPTVIPTVTSEVPSISPTITIAPPSGITTATPEPSPTPTPDGQAAGNKEEPPTPPESKDQKNESGAIQSVINKIIDPIKEIFKEEKGQVEEPTPIDYPTIESQWNTKETYYMNNKPSRKVSNLLLSLAGGLISGGFSLLFEPKLPLEYLNKLRKGNIYRTIIRIFL